MQQGQTDTKVPERLIKSVYHYKPTLFIYRERIVPKKNGWKHIRSQPLLLFVYLVNTEKIVELEIFKIPSYPFLLKYMSIKIILVDRFVYQTDSHNLVINRPGVL